jgi:hypothetical protein
MEISVSPAHKKANENEKRSKAKRMEKKKKREREKHTVNKKSLGIVTEAH